MSVKITLKAIESWLVAAVIPESTVCLHQGHNNLTQYDTTRGLPFQRMKSGLLGTHLTAWGFRRANAKESTQNKLCTVSIE